MPFLDEEAIDRIIAAGRTKQELRRAQPDTSDKHGSVNAQVVAFLRNPYPPPEPAIDKIRLMLDLDAVATEVNSRKARQLIPTEQQMRDRVEKIARLAGALRKELEGMAQERWLRIDLECRADAYAREHGQLPPRSAELGDGLVGADIEDPEAVTRVVAAVTRLDEWLSRRGPHPELEYRWRHEVEQRQGDLTHWLFGHALAEVYERHFGRKAAVSRPSEGGRARGPYVKFALAVASEIGFRKTTGDPYGTESVANALKLPN
jgi:hypothetical protein